MAAAAYDCSYCDITGEFKCDITHRENHISAPLDMKGCICHVVKWKIHLFISKMTFSGVCYWGYRVINVTSRIVIIILSSPWIWKGASATLHYRPLGYERVYLPLCKVADAPFHTQGDVFRRVLLGLPDGYVRSSYQSTRLICQTQTEWRPWLMTTR